jgi:hypothetical protein
MEFFTKMPKSDPAVSLTPRNPNFSNDYLDFLGEYEVICETALARESGPSGDCLMKKTEGRKFRDTAPLSEIFRLKNRSVWQIPMFCYSLLMRN